MRMLVTRYPVSSDWSNPDCSQPEEDTMASQYSASSSLICSDLINIQTTLSETFTPHTNILQPPPQQHPSSTTSNISSTSSNTSNNNSDYFSQHFENVMESVPTPSNTNSVCSSHSSIGQRDINYEDYSANGNVNIG